MLNQDIDLRNAYIINLSAIIAPIPRANPKSGGKSKQTIKNTRKKIPILPFSDIMQPRFLKPQK